MLPVVEWVSPDSTTPIPRRSYVPPLYFLNQSCVTPAALNK